MTRKHHRLTILGLGLVAAAIMAPAASAYNIGPNPDQAALIAASQPAQAPAVQPNPDQIGSGTRSLSPQEFAALTRQTPAVQVKSDSGFDWGDAGIGAGAMFALTMIGVGTALVVSSRRQREARAA